jgi:hypothetical protein
MHTPRSLLLPATAAVALLLCAAPAGAAAPGGGWFPTQGFAAGGPSWDEPVPRAGIARDGTSAVAFRTRTGALLVATGTARGRFGAARVIDRTGAGDYSVAAAPGGAFLVAWEGRDGLHAAVRTQAGRRVVQRRYAGGPHSEINGVQVAADPQGGWVLAQRVFPHGTRRDRLYGVRALSLDAAGRPLGAAQDLGPGYFGVDARPTQALAVDRAGRAVLAFRREAPMRGPAEPEPVVVATRPHGGSFGTPVALPGPPAADPRVTVDDTGRALVAVTQIASRGDAGFFGSPAVAGVSPDGTPGLPAGPALDFPKRAFGPSAALTNGGAALVFQLKERSEPFSQEAPVRAVTIRADGTVGALQTLTGGRAKEPVAVPLTGGRVLVVWSGRRGIGAALAVDGTFRRTAEPKGPPPPPYHFNPTNRDLRSAGRHAIFTWSRAGRVRVAVRAF